MKIDTLGMILKEELHEKSILKQYSDLDRDFELPEFGDSDCLSPELNFF